MTGSADLVSVIIPTHDRPATIDRAVASVLDQTHPAVEVIVVDDGSRIPARVATKDERVRVVRQDPARGVARARNLGVVQARGAFLAFLDDDDILHPHKLATQLAYLRENPGADAVFSHVEVERAGGARHWHPNRDHVHSTFINFFCFNVIHTLSALIRRPLLDHVAWDERLTKYTDTQFFLALTVWGRVDFLPGPVGVWIDDKRADQITAKNPRKSLRNFRLICEIFRQQIDGDHRLARRYYGRLGADALRCGDMLTAAHAAIRLLPTLLRRGSRDDRAATLIPQQRAR